MTNHLKITMVTRYLVNGTEYGSLKQAEDACQDRIYNLLNNLLNNNGLVLGAMQKQKIIELMIAERERIAAALSYELPEYETFE
jgi:hypothetical protein